MEGAEEILRSLCEKYRLYIVTNGSISVQKGRIESAGLKNYVQDIFISEALGYNKPRKEYFDLCFDRIPNFCKENTIMVGDSLSADIQGGKNAGLLTVWFNPENTVNDSSVAPDYEISELTELKSVISCIDSSSFCS